MAEEKVPTTPATEAGGVPKGLEKFAGTDGKLDVAKLSQSYLETERMAHEATQKRADAERAYAVLAQQYGGATQAAAAGSGVVGRGGEGDDDTSTEREELTRTEAAPVVQALIETIHPEIAFDPAINAYKDQAFIDGLKGYVQQLPVTVKQAIARGDFAMQDWAIKQYKAIKGSSKKAASQAVPGERPNFLEGGTPREGDGRKQWSNEEIKALARDNPKEYARVADTEIADAYREGRVK